LTDAESIKTSAPAIPEAVRRQGTFLALVVLASLLRIYAISLYPLAGDEYGSLAEAKTLGLNWNSIIYSIFMHVWTQLGSSEFWLRLPSAILGVATVAILFKIGEKLGGRRTGVIAGLLAATSPFSIHHSQEVRFYSLVIFAAAAFLLVTVLYLEAPRTLRVRALLLVSGAGLLLAHFLGMVALYAQIAAAAFAIKSKWSRRWLALILFGAPVAASALLFTPFVRHELWRLYRIFGNAPASVEPLMTPISIMSLAKSAFAGFVFVFGYHVYPLRLALVIGGTCLSGFLLLAGARKLWKETRWGVLPFAYLLAVVVVYVVLDAVGGRVASGVSPRHVAFAWPAFLLLTAFGVTSFKRPLLYILLAGVLTVNAFSIWSAWSKDWVYGISTDYRAAAEFAQRWIAKDMAILHDGRSADAVKFYFPNSVPRLNTWPYLQDRNLVTQIGQQRLILVTDDWEAKRRRGFDQFMAQLSEGYSIVDGHVDYPLFEYVLDRKPSADSSGYAIPAGSNQVQLPVSFYGTEFQDLHLPISVRVREFPLNVVGAYALPDAEGRNELAIPLAHARRARRVIFLSNVVETRGLRSGQQIAELSIEAANGSTFKFPVRLGSESASWDAQCGPSAPCRTVFQWRKRIAIANQNSYEGAWRDFPAGLHGVIFDLPESQDILKLGIHYTSGAGRFYVWGIGASE